MLFRASNAIIVRRFNKYPCHRDRSICSFGLSHVVESVTFVPSEETRKLIETAKSRVQRLSRFFFFEKSPRENGRKWFSQFFFSFLCPLRPSKAENLKIRNVTTLADNRTTVGRYEKKIPRRDDPSVFLKCT